MECRKYLRCETNGHQKHYFIAVVHDGVAYRVRTAWGRIGKPPQGEKYAGGYSSLGPALVTVDKLVHEKLGKDYEIAWENMASSGAHQNVWLEAKRKKWPGVDVGEPDWFDVAPGLPNATVVTGSMAARTSNIQQMPKKKRGVVSGTKKPPVVKMFRKNADWNF